MKTPYAKYWMTAELLHALGPEDEDAELQAWVRADLDEAPLMLPTAAAARAADSASVALQPTSAPLPPSSSSPV